MSSPPYGCSKISEVIDRRRKLAVFPMVCADHCAYLQKKAFKDVATDGAKLAEVLNYGYQLYKYDMVLVFSDPYVEAEAMGCELEYSPYPHIKRVGIKPTNDRRQEIIRAAEILKRRVPVPVFVSIKGPFTLAGFISGIENFLKWLIRNPQKTYTALQKALQFQLDYLQGLLKIPVNILIGDPLASSSIISADFFEKFVWAPLRVLITEIKKKGVLVGVHICGNVRPIVNLLDQLNADILSIEDITLKTKTLKMGGVSTITLLRGTNSAIQKEIESAINLERLILSTSCDVPVNTPVENIKAMIEFARSYEH
ncbi:MAG: uroporphyrinogen decarboxylase family protein [candidate division WOR-3 bacterium]